MLGEGSKLHPYCWILENREKEIRKEDKEDKEKREEIGEHDVCVTDAMAAYCYIRGRDKEYGRGNRFTQKFSNVF